LSVLKYKSEKYGFGSFNDINSGSYDLFGVHAKPTTYYIKTKYFYPFIKSYLLQQNLKEKVDKELYSYMPSYNNSNVLFKKLVTRSKKRTIKDLFERKNFSDFTFKSGYETFFKKNWNKVVYPKKKKVLKQ